MMILMMMMMLMTMVTIAIIGIDGWRFYFNIGFGPETVAYLSLCYTCCSLLTRVDSNVWGEQRRMWSTLWRHWPRSSLQLSSWPSTRPVRPQNLSWLAATILSIDTCNI